jgi:uncharacterized repeat protein (TIGR03803 family)
MLFSTSRALLTTLLVAGAPLAASAASSGVTTLYAFPAGNPYQEDELPHGKFLYGTTNVGGANGYGTLYKLDIATGAETTLYSFTGGTDGCNPQSPLTKYNGLYYGTTARCGANHHGTVFSTDLKSGAVKTLYSFNLGTNGDGGYPSGKLLAFGGYLWGITEFGGANYAGTLFKIDPTTGVETVAYSFGAGSDAGAPDDGVIEAGGILYGTTQGGGVNNGGTVYAYNPATGREKVLHSFGKFGGSDGYYPASTLLAVGGELYGTTQNGGAGSQGTIFKVQVKDGKETVLYSFTGDADGAFPFSSLTPLKGEKTSGKLYGLTVQGGTNYSGTIFMFDTTSNTLTPEYSFTNGTDGGFPYSGLTQANGVFYGNTSNGGANGGGTVFSFSP